MITTEPISVPQRVVNLIGLSGGKDSTRLWGWAFHESGYAPATIQGVFTDTENEYDEVYEQVSALCAYGQVRGAPPVAWLHPPLGFLDLCLKKKRFPGAKTRFCTELLKIKPLQGYVANLQAAGAEVITHNGVRKKESFERSLMEEWAFSGMLNCRERRPLLDMAIEEVWAGHKRYELPINPLYFTGRRRVGCRLCCMSNKQDVRITARTRPETIELYAEWERLVSEARTTAGVATFFPYKTVPLHLRSHEYYSAKQEKTFRVATIHDVVKWATTAHGGRQTVFDFWHDDAPIFDIDDAHSPCKSGFCE